MVKYLFGGDQERERRASTQNVAGFVGMGKAVELCQMHMDSEVAQQTRLRRRIHETVLRDIPGSRLNGDPDNRLPNNAHFSFEGVEGESLLMSLDMSGIATSMGSACTSGALEPSHVLRAIGLSDDLALGSLRITIGRWTTEAEVDYFLDQLKDKVAQLRL
jgi:cysteine desulfurase